MKCPSCDQQIIIKTDPENRTYKFVEGLRKMEHEYEPDNAVEEAVVIAGVSDEVKEKLVSDPIFKLQHDNECEVKVSSVNSNLSALIDKSDDIHKVNYQINSMLRKQMREKKSEIALQLEEGRKRNVPYAILPLDDMDLPQVSFKRKQNAFQASERSKFKKIQSESIFAMPKKQL